GRDLQLAPSPMTVRSIDRDRGHRDPTLLAARNGRSRGRVTGAHFPVSIIDRSVDSLSPFFKIFWDAHVMASGSGRWWRASRGGVVSGFPRAVRSPRPDRLRRAVGRLQSGYERREKPDPDRLQRLELSRLGRRVLP